MDESGFVSVSKALKCAAAQAELARVKRSQATMSYTLALGRADLFPEMPVTVAGFKPDIDETPWLVNLANGIAQA